MEISNSKSADVRLLRIGKAASELGISTQAVRRLADSGKLPVTRTQGGHRRFHPDDLSLFKANHLRNNSRSPQSPSGSSLEAGYKINIPLTSEISFADLVEINPGVSERVLRDLLPQLDRLTRGPGFQTLLDTTSKMIQTPFHQDIFDKVHMLGLTPANLSSVSNLVNVDVISDLARPLIESHAESLRHLANRVSPAQQVLYNLNELFDHGKIRPAITNQAMMFDRIDLKPASFDFLASITNQWKKAVFNSGLPLIDLDRLHKSVASALTESSVDQLRAAADRFGPHLERLRRKIEDDESTIVAFEAIGWPVAPSMSRELKRRVVHFYSQGNSRGAVLAILGFYRRRKAKHLIDAAEQWSELPAFSDRICIIRDALEAHLERKYTLSVPAVLPQVEGIMYDILGLSSHAQGKPNELSKEFIGDSNEWLLDDYVLATTLLSCLVNNTYSWVSFRDAQVHQPNRRPTNRHTVVHGVTTSYATEGHSLKSFLLLDTIGALVFVIAEHGLDTAA